MLGWQANIVVKVKIKDKESSLNKKSTKRNKK